jgi:NAD(P)-dependent dehydrogenase (short-subunit alcohol dehydrogenase family)
VACVVAAAEHGAVIVTGASRGIGAAVAKLAAARGFPVAVNFERDEKSAATTVAEIMAAGGHARAIRANVGREEDVVRLFEAADREFGFVQALVNNAGVTGGGLGRLENVTAAAVQQMLEVNVLGAILCCREAVKRMSIAKGGRGGALVNISSLAARTGAAGEWVHYAASKGAINSLTIGLAREVAAEGIRVNAVAPGLIDTELHAAAGAPDRLQRLKNSIPMQRPGSAEEVAAGVVWLLSPEASYITGTILEIGGGR